MTKVFITSNTGGSPTQLLEFGRIIGQVAEGMLVVDMSFDVPIGEIEGPWHLKRYVGSSPSDVTGPPDEFFTYTDDDPDSTIESTYTSAGVACKGTTAILVGKHKVDAGSPMQGVIYRSTNKGLAFIEVKRWDLDSTTEKFGHIEVGYAGQKDGVWWCGGADDGVGGMGVWRSEDDGLTWTFVASPDIGLSTLDNTPQIISTARPDGTSR